MQILSSMKSFLTTPCAHFTVHFFWSISMVDLNLNKDPVEETATFKVTLVVLEILGRINTLFYIQVFF